MYWCSCNSACQAVTEAQHVQGDWSVRRGYHQGLQHCCYSWSWYHHTGFSYWKVLSGLRALGSILQHLGEASLSWNSDQGFPDWSQGAGGQLGQQWLVVLVGFLCSHLQEFCFPGFPTAVGHIRWLDQFLPFSLSTFHNDCSKVLTTFHCVNTERVTLRAFYKLIVKHLGVIRQAWCIACAVASWDTLSWGLLDHLYKGVIVTQNGRKVLNVIIQIYANCSHVAFLKWKRQRKRTVWGVIAAFALIEARLVDAGCAELVSHIGWQCWHPVRVVSASPSFAEEGRGELCIMNEYHVTCICSVFDEFAVSIGFSIFPCNMMAVEVFNSHIDVFSRYFMEEVKSLSGWFTGRAYREIEFGWFRQHNLP